MLPGGNFRLAHGLLMANVKEAAPWAEIDRHPDVWMGTAYLFLGRFKVRESPLSMALHFVMALHASTPASMSSCPDPEFPQRDIPAPVARQHTVPACSRSTSQPRRSSKSRTPLMMPASDTFRRLCVSSASLRGM